MNRFPIACLIGTIFCINSSQSWATLTNRYSFTNAAGAAASGTVITDSVGTANATVQGNGSTFTGTEISLTGATNGNQTAAAISGYVNLPNGMISTKTNVSVELWATVLSNKSQQRLFDFGRSASSPYSSTGELIDSATAPGNIAGYDNLYLTPNYNGSLNTTRLSARNNGTATAQSTATTTTINTQYHYVFTFQDGAGTYGAAGGQIKWYKNGSLMNTLDINFHLSDVEDLNNWLGRSQFTQDSNANIKFNECRIYDHTLSLTEILADYAAGPDTLPGPPTPPPTPDHLWVFNNQALSDVASGLVFTDSVTGMPLTLLGNGASLTGTSVVLPGSTTGNQPASAISAYLDFPNGIVSAHPSMTFEAWCKPLSAKAYMRLFDFGRGNLTTGTGAAAGEIIDGSVAPGASYGYDNLVISLCVGTTLGQHRLEGQIANGTAIFTDNTIATTAGTEYHYVFVIEDGVGTYGSAGSQIRWYRNGALQNSLDLAFHSSAMQDVNNWIGRSQYTGDSNSNISLNEVRIYNHALSVAEIAASYTAGADTGNGGPEPAAPAQTPDRKWDFNVAAGAAPEGTTFADSGTGELITTHGVGATLSGTQVTLPGTTNGNQTAAAISAYLDLPNGIISSKTNLTFEMWLTPLSNKLWQRAFDFGNTNTTYGTGAAVGEIIDGAAAPGAFYANDNLLLSFDKDSVLGAHRIEGKLGGANVVTVDTDLSGSTALNTEYHYVMTVEDGVGTYGSTGCRVKYYRNASLQGSMDLSFRLKDLHDVNNWIGRSLWAADSNSNMSVNEVRLYERTLSPAEVLTSYNAGPNTTFPVPATTADAATIHEGKKVLLNVLANDAGTPLSSTLEIVSPPSVGTATVMNDKILYAHSSGTAPVTFTYRVKNVSGFSAATTVTINISSELRITPAFTLPSAPPATNIAVVNAFPGVTFNKALVFTTPPGDTTRLFVGEIGGILKVIPDVTATTPTSATVLNLNTVVTTPARTPAETITAGANGECGLLGVAFHPQYATNGYIYIAYSATKAGIAGFSERVSRFTVPAAQINSPTPVADPTSELILIEQYDQGANHNGGDLHFAADGYLYWSVGDEENANDFRLNSQRIDKDFFAGMFRIDVDKKPGNLEPNPHASVPLDAGIARYSVPVDNPYIGATSFNGLTVDPAAVRTEFYCTGLRSPWRFSIDPPTGEIWCGDVGQDKYEELDIIEKGVNYGWVFREGMHDIGVTNAGWPAKPNPFISTDPIYEYNHPALAGDANFKGNSIIGGVVYRGTKIPSLTGKYIFGDQVAGHIWALTKTGNTVTSVERIAGQAYLSNFGKDPSNGDVLVSDYFGGRIMRIVAQTPENSYPLTLSDTGLFADLTDLSPSPGLLPYTPNITFWSDYAVKQRWFSLPNAAAKINFAQEDPWTFPDGMIWVKHFDMEMERGNPATKKRIETRILVKNATGAYGVSYRWNEAGTEATLVEDSGVTFPLSISVGGSTISQTWGIPSRAQCMNCHTAEGGFALSFQTRQMNRDASIHNFGTNQIAALEAGGCFNIVSPAPSLLPRHPALTDTAVPVEKRVRAYFDVNCAYCHRPGGAGPSWDGRSELTLEQTGLINGSLAASLNSGDKLVVPQDTTHSAVLSRISLTNGYTRMPPLGSYVTDPTGIALVTEWIGSARSLYDQWKLNYYTETDPDNVKTADPDGDGLTNYEEYLLGSAPNSGTNFWQATVAPSSGILSLNFTRKANRFYEIETSTNLLDWSPWDVPQNHDNYFTSDTLENIPVPANEVKRFFRFKVSEP